MVVISDILQAFMRAASKFLLISEPLRGAPISSPEATVVTIANPESVKVEHPPPTAAMGNVLQCLIVALIKVLRLFIYCVLTGFQQVETYKTHSPSDAVDPNEDAPYFSTSKVKDYLFSLICVHVRTC
jgi:hypothetical protein